MLIRDAIIACDRCPRLRQYCQRIAREKRAAFRDDTYWARPVPGFGDPRAVILLLGLAPAAHGGNPPRPVVTRDPPGARLVRAPPPARLAPPARPLPPRTPLPPPAAPPPP